MRSCEVAIISPDLCISTTLQETTTNKSPWNIRHVDGIYVLIYLDFDADFHGRKCSFQGGLPRLPPVFPTKISDSHGPYDPHPIITPLREAIRHLQRCRLCRGVVGQTSKTLPNVTPKGTYQNGRPPNHQQVYVCRNSFQSFGFIDSFGGFRDAWGMLQGYVGGFLRKPKHGHLFWDG